MNNFKRVMIDGLVGSAIVAAVAGAFAMVIALAGKAAYADTNGIVLDYNEQTHLEFMREEEKLARDVYIELSTMYPDHPVFGKIDDSEQKHTDAVKAMIEKYGLEDPNTNDNVGVYTGNDYGWYFTEKFQQLVERASVSELDALYVGAFIEELDMMDINQCPQVIIETDNDINDVTECGKVYTDNEDVDDLYASLLDGSDSHLEGYVKNIEKYIGEGNYQAQVLPQEQVDELIGR
ncbi:MAG: DUF2202 domain-containing protein [Gammaproteobacteria bacterium]